MIQVPGIEELQGLGFTAAARGVQEQRSIATKELRDKLRTAFEFYKVVRPEYLKRFDAELKAKTLKRKNVGEYVITQFYKLCFMRIENYPHVPPPEVLTALREAKERKCFDSFHIATAELVVESQRVPRRMPDPILFGHIDQSENYYYIAQWDDDVRIEDILKEGEG